MIIKETSEPKFKRAGNDLIYTHTISLVDAINSLPVRVETLDGRVLSIPVDSVINP